MSSIPAIDFHAHIGYDRDGFSCTKKQLLESMREANIVGSVIFPFDEKNVSVNDASMQLLKETKNDGHLFYPFFRFDPKRTTADDLSDKLKMFYGVKLHPRSQGFDPLHRKFRALFEVMEESGKPLLIHTRKEKTPDEFERPILKYGIGKNFSFTDPDIIIELANRYPELRLVLAHFANVSGRVLKLIGTLKNVYLETSIMGSTPATIEKYAVKHCGIDKVIFGSDITYGDQLIERLKIDRSGLSEGDKRKILYENAAKLLGINK